MRIGSSPSCSVTVFIPLASCVCVPCVTHSSRLARDSQCYFKFCPPPPAHSPPIYSYISACLSFVLTAQAQIPFIHSPRRPSTTFYSLSFSDLFWPATTARLLAFTSSAGPTTIPGFFYSSCPGLELLLLSYQFLSITELIGWISATSDYR